MNAIQKTINVVVKFTQQGLQGINKQIDKLNAATVNFTKSTNNASAATRKFDNELKRANNTAGNAGKATNNASKSTRSFASSVGRAINIVAQFTVAMYGVQAVQKAFSFFTIDSARAAIEFQAALASLQAIANVSSKDMQTLEKVIFDVAGTTRFSAIEIAELQKELSRLGFTTEEVVASTDAIARFAEAIGSDLGQAAQFVGKQLQAFGLNASSAFEVTNAFTALINNSALSMETLATSMQYASSIASSLGVSIQETGALLGVLTNNGITASRAGTGLRQIFLELGADGGSLINILNELAGENLSLSEAEELVGKRAAGALSVLVRQRREVNTLVQEQRNLTAATIASARQNATFAGQIKLATAQINAEMITLGRWVTRTSFLLDFIERFGGGLEARKFSVLATIGLSSEETQSVIDNMVAMTDIVTNFVKTREQINPVQIKNLLGVDFDRAAEISVALEKAMSIGGDYEKNLASFIQMFGQMKIAQMDLEEINKEAIKRTDKYSESIENLSAKAKQGIDIEKERDAVYESMADRQSEIAKEMERIRALGVDVTQDKQFLTLEKETERLNSLMNILFNIDSGDGGLTEEILKGFEAIFDLQKRFVEASKVGDIPLAENLQAELDAQLKLLREKGLLDKYNAFVQQFFSDVINPEEAFEGLQQDPESAQKYLENYFQFVREWLQNEIDSGNISLEQAGKAYSDTLTEALLSIDDLTLRKELEAKIMNALNLKPRDDSGDMEKDGGISDELENLIIQRSREVAQAGADAAFDATRRRLDAEQEAVDARYSYEEDRLQSLVDNNLITQAEYERKREQLERERIQKTNEIEKNQFESDKARALVDLAIDTAIAISSRGFDPIQSAIILAASAVQAGIISAQKFIPVQFEEGGMVQGRSHREGGVPFTVQGVGGYEMEGGEYIVNKKATAKYLPMLEQINSYGKVNNSMFKHFANGGLTGMEGTMGMGESARINAMLLQRLNQPIRAYVSERELMTKSNERINQKMKSRL